MHYLMNFFVVFNKVCLSVLCNIHINQHLAYGVNYSGTKLRA